MGGVYLCGAVFDDTFWQYPSGRNFGKPLWELALDSNCGKYLIVSEKLQISDWYYRVCIFMFFSCWYVFVFV